MKKFYFLVLLIAASANAQIVTIPDANFKAKLLAADVTNTIASTATNATIPTTFNKIDVNDDGEIQQSEAANVTLLNVSNSNISDLTGIEAFVSLHVLKCQNNQITSLNPNNSTILVWLDCQDNLITELAVNNLIYLQGLLCYNNHMTSLELSNLTSLYNLYCGNNQLTSLNLSGSPFLSQLGCENNQLTTLTTTGSNNITILDCSANPLTSLDVSAMANLAYLACMHTLITTLDCENNTHLTSLYIHGNSLLEEVYIKNGSDESSQMDPGSWLENWNNLPNLHFVCADESQVASIQSLLPSGSVLVSSYCSFTPGGNYNTITGTTLFDADNNGCDGNDIQHPNIKMTINDGTSDRAAFTNGSGNYAFYTSAGIFTLAAQIENPSFFTISPETVNISFPDSNNNSIVQNFCISANGIHPDLEIIIVPIAPARPGFDAIYKITYRNKGNQTMTQDYGVTFFYNQNLMEFISADVVPSTNGPGALTWSYANLLPFESRSIVVTLHINAPTDANPVNIGNILDFNAAISPVSGDETMADNYFAYHQTVVGSFDPNAITCIEGEVVSTDEIGNYLHYIINFENTGTAAAQNIVVKDIVDPAKFDINSLQILSSSHALDARVNGNVVELIFKNIYLDTGGHGNVLLKIKTKEDLVTGNSVAAKADIFFDYNFPVATNTANTVFQNLGINDRPLDASISISPNPTTGIVNIKANNAIQSVQLFDVQGRLLQTHLGDANEEKIDIASQANGIYFVKITSEKGIKIEKIIKK